MFGPGNVDYTPKGRRSGKGSTSRGRKGLRFSRVVVGTTEDDYVWRKESTREATKLARKMIQMRTWARLGVNLAES